MTVLTAGPTAWLRTGLVLGRSRQGDGSAVVGDPCVVWDPDAGAWRMVLFFDPPGHADAVSPDPTGAPGTWSAPHPLAWTNPDALPPGGGTHKPFIVTDAHHPNQAAKVDGRYWLVTVSFTGDARDKHVQRAWATSLAGPWTLEAGALIPPGGPGDFDELHTDAVSGYWFADRGEFLYFYMGYPRAPQPWPHSPYGSAIGAATQRPGRPAVKVGAVLPPSPEPRSWASGWLGGLQLLPGRDHRWVGVVNASPTPPDRSGGLTSEEPPPSLGGLAFSDAEFPAAGWTLAAQPFERIEALSPEALTDGEGVNLWRHHVLVTPAATRLFYNSGPYGQEQLFSKTLVGAQPWA